MQITGGNIDDRSPVMTLVKDISAKLIGDKGYISKNYQLNYLTKTLP